MSSQRRELLENSGYKITSTWPDVDAGCVILTDDSGKRELWHRNNRFAGYVVVIEGLGYEFVRSL